MKPWGLTYVPLEPEWQEQAIPLLMLNLMFIL